MGKQPVITRIPAKSADRKINCHHRCVVAEVMEQELCDFGSIQGRLVLNDLILRNAALYDRERQISDPFTERILIIGCISRMMVSKFRISFIYQDTDIRYRRISCLLYNRITDIQRRNMNPCCLQVSG